MDAERQLVGAPKLTILVHGALRSRAGLVPTAGLLRRRGLQTELFGYTTRRGSLTAHGRALREFAATRASSVGSNCLGLLTHSMGGLVARAALRDAPPPARRVRLVMLAPPNQGASLASTLSRPARALYGDGYDALVEQVHGLGPLPEFVDALILCGGRGDGKGINPKIQGDDDGVVGVAESVMTGVPLMQVGGTHSFLQWRRDVLEVAAAFLRSGAVPAGAATP